MSPIGAADPFPLLGDYQLTLTDVEQQAQALQQNPEAWERVQQRFDPLAAQAFYQNLATLAPDTLVDDLPCPLYCFWGDHDSDAVELVLPHQEYESGLSQRRIPFDIHSGYDHEALNAALQIALPPAAEWLLTHAREQGI